MPSEAALIGITHARVVRPTTRAAFTLLRRIAAMHIFLQGA